MEPSSQRYSWRMVEVGQPLERIDDAAREPDAGEVLIEIAGCGLCHTDLGFLDGDVPTKAGLPIILGHEIAGTVVAAGPGEEHWIGAEVLVPAVIPCQECAMCRAGRGNVCTSQLMPGNDIDGGFATHVTLPARGLAAVPALPDGYELADMCVIADAVTTPLQAVRRANVTEGDFVVVVGTGGVGGYAVQVAAASGAIVIALDIDDAHLTPLLDHGAAGTLNVRGLDTRAIRGAVRDHAASHGAGNTGWKIFECSGTPQGQETAYSLLGSAGTLAIVGFTMEKVTIRLSNLMAFDAAAFGSWGCPPQRYPEAIELVTSGKVALLPFTRKVPMADLPQVLEAAHGGSDPRRTILIP